MTNAQFFCLGFQLLMLMGSVILMNQGIHKKLHSLQNEIFGLEVDLSNLIKKLNGIQCLASGRGTYTDDDSTINSSEKEDTKEKSSIGEPSL